MTRIPLLLGMSAMLLLPNVGCKEDVGPTADTEPTAKAESTAVEPEAKPSELSSSSVQHVTEAVPIVIPPPDARDLPQWKPIVTLIEWSHFGSATFFGDLQVAIYESGEILHYAYEQRVGWRYYLTKLPPGEMDTLRTKLISFGDYSILQPRYNIMPTARDLPEVRVFVALDNVEVATTGIGFTGSGEFFDLDPSDLDDGARVLWNLCKYLSSLEFANAQPWDPPAIDLSICRSYGFGGRPVPWPAEWPGPTSPYATKRDDGSSFSVRLPGDQLSRLRTLASADGGVHVTIGGTVWAVRCDFVFPGEEFWRRALYPYLYEEDEPTPASLP